MTSFPPNGYGLYNITGNVWGAGPGTGSIRPYVKATGHETRRPAVWTSRVQKGGSYLCHHSYCRRYRVAARQGLTPDSSTGNVGFRCFRDG